jgi:CRISPR-associated protein Cas1
MHCLADDIMEPYRPYVDWIVCHIMDTEDSYEELTIEIKKTIVEYCHYRCNNETEKKSLMVAMSRTTHSLQACFEGSTRKILYTLFM